MKKLIVNADDFGMSPEINEGIKRGIKAGVVTSVSVMANMPYIDDAVAFLKKHPEISVGLHLNLTEGSPVSGLRAVSTLVREDGNFYYWKGMVLNLMTKTVSLVEIQHELVAQYNTLKKSGILVDHIDSHHHIHLYPPIYKLLIRFVFDHHIMMLRSRTFRPRRVIHSLIRIRSLKQFTILAMYSLNSMLYRPRWQLFEIDQLYDMNWDPNLDEEKLMRFLNHLSSGVTVMICHPAVASKKGNPLFLMPRNRELRILLNRKVIRRIQRYSASTIG